MIKNMMIKNKHGGRPHFFSFWRIQILSLTFVCTDIPYDSEISRKRSVEMLNKHLKALDIRQDGEGSELSDRIVRLPRGGLIVDTSVEMKSKIHILCCEIGDFFGHAGRSCSVWDASRDNQRLNELGSTSSNKFCCASRTFPSEKQVR